MHVRCAHTNGLFEVTGRVVQVSASRYTGRLYSSQYDVTGKVTIRISGSRQTLNANSPKGTAAVILTKQ